MGGVNLEEAATETKGTDTGAHEEGGAVTGELRLRWRRVQDEAVGGSTQFW